jgi:uncharacterized delta-60 repeat protein
MGGNPDSNIRVKQYDYAGWNSWYHSAGNRFENQSGLDGHMRTKERNIGARVSAFRAEGLESRVLLSHGAPMVAAHPDAAAVRAILAQPVAKASSSQLAQIAELGLVPMDWNGHQIFAEKDQWVISIVTGRGKLNKQVKAAQKKVGSLISIDRHLGKQNLFLASVPAGTKADKLLKSLKAIPGFVYAEPNAVVGVGSVPNDPEFSKQWSLNNTGQTGGTNDADIDAPEAWNTTAGSANVIVGVIDTGIDITHPDLSANVWTNPLEIPGDGIDNDANGYVDDIHGWDFYNSDNDPSDDNGHGTHVAGIIAASGDNNIGIAGISQRAQVLAIKAFGPDGFGLTADCVNAVNYATALKVRGENVRVINNSWGGGAYSQALHDAIAASGAANMLFVAAAGNYSADTDATPYYPASYDLTNIISVAATDENDQLAVFSNFGKTSVDLAAPGTDIYSTVPGGGYDFKSGTSIAAAHVAGAAALLWGFAPETTPQTLKQSILSNVDVLGALTNKVASKGRLNVQKAFSGLGMIVTGSTPAAGEVVTTNNIMEWKVLFSAPIDSATLAATDLKVNGKSPDFAFVTGAQQASFAFTGAPPLTSPGLQTITMAMGAVSSVGGLPLIGWSSTFYYDPTPLVVQSTTPTNGSAASVPFTTLRVKFNEAIDFSSVSAGDLLPSQGSVTGVTSIDSSTVQFNLSGITQEGALSVSIPAGAIKDAAGNPSQAYSGSFVLDSGANPVPMSFSPVSPAGSLVYEAKATGSLSSAGDTDAYEVTVAAGQLLTVAIEPSARTLRPSISLRDSNGVTVASANASAGGKTAFVASYLVPTAGSYRFVVSSISGSGAYTVRATLNADLEREPITGVENGSMGAAQNLDGDFVSPVASNSGGTAAARAGVRGKLKSSPESDYYAVTLTAGETLAVIMQQSQNAGISLSLLNSSGTLLASAMADPNSGNLRTGGITALVSGVYYVKVTTAGMGSIDYTLEVGRNVYLDMEPNQAGMAGVQTLGADGAAVGSVGLPTVASVLASDTFTGGALDARWSTYTSDPARGLVRVESVSSDGVGGALILSLNSSGAYVLNEAVWTVDLSDAVSPILSFAHASYNDEVQLFDAGDISSGHVIGDGIMISNDGVRWHAIWTPPVVAPYMFNYTTVDLAAEAARAGMPLGPDFKIKFQQYGQDAEVSDGRGFDDIRILDQQPDTDSYLYTGSAGQELHVTASAITAGGGLEGSNLLDPILSLYDSSNNLIAYDHQGADDGQNAEIYKVLPAAGTYRIVVSSGASGEYLLRAEIVQAGPASAPDLMDASDTGGIDTDDVTRLNNSSPETALMFVVTGVDAGAVVKLYADGVLIGQSDTGGTSRQISTDGVTLLADGAHQITYTRTAAGGEESEPSRALTVTIDTVPPEGGAAPTLLSSSDRGPSNSDGITNDSTPTLAIPDGGAGTLYEIFRDGVAEPVGLIAGGYYATGLLADGVYSFALAMVDAAGNVGPVSAALQVTIDTVAPDAPGAPELDPGSDTGSSNSDRLTKDNTPTLSLGGAGYFALRLDGVNVPGGPFTGSYTANSLADGIHTFALASVDTAGNQSGFGPELSITIDTVAPRNLLAGDPDPDFATTGQIVTDYSVAYEAGGAVTVQTDGKILFAGNYWDGSTEAVFVVRYLPGGVLDTTFGTNGKSTFVVPGTNENNVRSIAVLSNGKIIVGGDANTNLAGGMIKRDMFVVRLTDTGALDNTFNTHGQITVGGTNTSEVDYSMVVAPDGKIWVAGQGDSGAVIGIATSDGYGWSGSGFTQGVRTLYIANVSIQFGIPHIGSLAVGPDNKIYAVGACGFTDDSFSSDLFVMRFNLDGSSDSSFGNSGFLRLATVGASEYPGGISVLSDGRIVIAYGSGGHMGVLRLLPTGGIDTTFGNVGRTVMDLDADGGTDGVSEMVIEADGKIVLAGNHQKTLPNPDFLVARLNADGSVDSTFGSYGRHSFKVGYKNSAANGLAVQSDNKILLVGTADSSATDQSSAIVRVLGVSMGFSFDLDAASDSGASNSDNYTNDSTPTFTISSPGPYDLYRDGVLIAAYSTQASFTDSAVPDGLHTYSLSVSDDAGNNAAPIVLKVTVDTSPDPVIPDLISQSDTGLSSTDNITSDNTPDFSFSGGIYQLRISRNGVEITPGYTSYPFSMPVQPDGTWNYTVQTIDLGGNISPVGAALTLTIDTVAPAMPPMPDLDPASDNGISDTDNITSIQSLHFLPLAADAPYVRFYRNGSLISGNYDPVNSSYTNSAQGSNSYTVGAVDIAGNVSALSPVLSVYVDTWAPSLSGHGYDDDFGFNISNPSYDLSAYNGAGAGKHVLLPDGRVLVAMSFHDKTTNIASAAFVRLMPDGSADPSFGVNGLAIATGSASYYTSIKNFKVLSDGRILAVGNYGTDPDNGPALMRFSALGVFDTSFGVNGIARIPGIVRGEGLDLAIQTDGKIVVAGYRYFNQHKDSVTARFSADGALDLSFGTGGAVIQSYSDTDDSLSAVGLQSDGKIVVAGSFEFLPNNLRFASGVIRYNTDGSLDTGFGVNGLALWRDNTQNAVIDAAVLSDDSVVAAGYLYNGVSSNRAILLMKFDGDGNPDASFGTSGIVRDHPAGTISPVATAFTALPSGKFLVAMIGNASIIRYNADGTRDTTFATDGIMSIDTGTVVGLSVDASNRIVTTGSLQSSPITGGFIARQYFTDPLPALDLLASSDSGISQTDDLTSDNTPDLTVIRSDAYYRVYDGGNLISGLWQTSSIFTPATPLSDGVHILTIRSVDPAGNISADNPPLTVTIQHQIAALELDAASDTGISDSDHITSDTTPTFNLAGARYKLYIDGQAVSDDFVSGPLTLDALTEGEYAVTYDAIDDAGNSLTGATAFDLTIDTTPPDAPQPMDLSAASDTGISASDDITKNNTPTFNFSPASHVHVYRGGVLVADLTDGTGSYTADTLPDGSYAFTLREVDIAGNESEASTPLVVHIDTVGPNEIQPVLVSGYTINEAGELVTHDDTPTIDVPGLYYFLNVNGIAASTGVEEGPSQLTHLGDGLHYLTALTFDAAGNETSSSELLVRVDTVPPKVISADFLLDGSPHLRIAFDDDVSQSLSADDLVLHDLTTGQDLAGATMSYDAQGNVVTWTFTGLPGGQLPTGDFTATLFADGVTDQAGNPVDGDGNGSAGGDLNVSFFNLPGDVNLDRSVGFADLVTVAQKYGKSANGWIEGDLNGDGVVGFADLVLVAQNYGKSLGTVPVGAPAPAAVVSAPARPASIGKASAIAKPVPVAKPVFGVARITSDSIVV